MRKNTLIPIPKKTQDSMGLLAISPEGTFKCVGDRWVRVYEARIRGNVSLMRLTMMLSRLTSHSRITLVSDGESNTPSEFAIEGKIIYLTLFQYGEDVNSVIESFERDEAMLSRAKEISEISLLPVNDAITIMTDKRQGRGFSYAAGIRGKKDWKRECFEEASEKEGILSVGEGYGQSMFVFQYPINFDFRVLENVLNAGLQIVIAVDVKPVDIADRMNLTKMLEGRYSKKNLDSEMGQEEYINLSVMLYFVSDSVDAVKIVEKTLLKILAKEGILATPSFGNMEKESFSIRTLGLIEAGNMRNICLRQEVNDTN